MSHTKFGKFGARQSDAPVYHPFGFNDTSWIPPQISYGSQNETTQYSFINNSDIGILNVPPSPVDETLQADIPQSTKDTKKPLPENIYCPNGFVAVNGNLICKDDLTVNPAYDFWEKMKQFAKDNPVIATGIIGTITYIIFKGK